MKARRTMYSMALMTAMAAAFALVVIIVPVHAGQTDNSIESSAKSVVCVQDLPQGRCHYDHVQGWGCHLGGDCQRRLP